MVVDTALEDFVGTERFQVVRRLGKGGMGVVYEVIDLERNERCALKTLRRLSANAVLRFKTEFRALQDLDNANLKGLLRRVIGKIFNDTEIKGWCKEFENKNLAPAVPEAASTTA